MNIDRQLVILHLPEGCRLILQKVLRFLDLAPGGWRSASSSLVILQLLLLRVCCEKGEWRRKTQAMPLRARQPSHLLSSLSSSLPRAGNRHKGGASRVLLNAFLERDEKLVAVKNHIISLCFVKLQ